MGMQRRSVVGGVVAGASGLLLLMLLGVLFVVYTGSYNIAASEDHSRIIRWGFDTTMKNSIERQAADIDVPAFNQEMVTAGAGEYKSMCQHCHGGPGVDPDPWSRGMLPQPPRLHEVADEWKEAEIFWLVKHGVKMTGMPAFGEDHGDDELWGMVAFVTQLPGMTAEEYARFENAHSSHHD